eukprot:918437-Prymnesium_polylepis.1
MRGTPLASFARPARVPCSCLSSPYVTALTHRRVGRRRVGAALARIAGAARCACCCRGVGRAAAWGCGSAAVPAASPRTAQHGVAGAGATRRGLPTKSVKA